jgi:hypothetical protein
MITSMQLNKKGCKLEVQVQRMQMRYSTCKLVVKEEKMQFHCASSLGVEIVNENKKEL